MLACPIWLIITREVHTHVVEARRGEQGPEAVQGLESAFDADFLVVTKALVRAAEAFLAVSPAFLG